jgi:hypothetical protein
MSGNTFNYTNTGTMTIHWTFEKDGKSTVVTTSNYNALDYSNSYTQCSAIYAPGSDSSNETATWDFASNKEDLEITYSDGSKETWNIIELRSNEMKLKMTDGTDIYEVTLEQ